MSFKTFIILFWTALLLFALYTFFFKPELFHQMFQYYPGPGSPYINTPQGN